MTCLLRNKMATVQRGLGSDATFYNFIDRIVQITYLLSKFKQTKTGNIV